MKTMKTIVYKLPQIKTKDTAIDVVYDEVKPSKLIKYGFNQTADDLNIIELTSDPHYRAGLNFDLDRSASRKFTMAQTHAEFWEVFLSFDLLSSNQSIQTSHPDIVEDVIKIYGDKIKSLTKITVNKSKKNNNLVIYKYSDIELDESISVQLILKDLPELLGSQTTGSNMVIQLFSLQTKPTIDLIYYITSNYQSVYLFKPNITSNLSSSCYLVCTNLLKNVNFPKVNDKGYVTNILDKSVKIPVSFTTCIQCYNSEIIPQKIITYNKIKSYLDSKVYEGLTYQEMISSQDENFSIWTEKYIEHYKDVPKYLSEGLDRTNKKCDYLEKLNNLFIE